MPCPLPRSTPRRALCLLALLPFLLSCSNPSEAPRRKSQETAAAAPGTVALLQMAEVGAAGLEPGSASAYGDFLAGEVAQRRGDLGKAAEFLNRALAADPDSSELLLDTFQLLLAEGRLGEARALAPAVVAASPGHGLAITLMAVEEAAKGNWNGADARLSELPQRGLSALIGPLLSAWTAAGLGDGAAALTRLEALDRQKGLEPLVRLHRALVSDVLGDQAAARRYFEESLAATEAPSLRVVWLAGNLLERMGERQRAETLYRDYLARSGGSDLIAWTLARLAEGQTPRAPVGDAAAGLAAALFDTASLLGQERAQELGLAYAHMAVSLAPDMQVAQILIGELLQEQTRHGDAIAAYRKVPADSPFFWGVRLRIASELDALGRTEEAIAELRALAAERPTEYEPLYRLGNLYRQKERFAEAAEAYELAVARIAEPRPEDWSLFYFRGIAYERSDRWPQAERDFLKALDLAPEQPFVLNYLAYSWVEKKLNLAEAEAMLKRAVELRPDDGYIVDSLGWVYYRLGRHQEAVELLERAVSLKPADPVINDHLGDAYWRIGRKREARIQWERSLSYEPEPEEEAKIRRKLQEGLPPDKDT